MNIRKLTITAFLIAINVVLSSLIVIPLGPIKAAPVQHFVNVLCAVLTGVIGSLMCIPLAWFLGLQDFFIKPLMLMFIVSSFIGALISYILLIILKRRGLLDRFNKN
ncbi:MAG: energy coupling factor transporter S component ThiW [Staphylococcus epidermidis]|nr:energy coupling factor transporter S component ThiW [Staphylococcus epidermidis]